MTKRKLWLTKHPAQAKYIVIVVVAMLLPTLVITLCFYHLVFYLLAKEMVFPEAIMTNLLPVISQIDLLIKIVIPVMAVTIVWLAVIISHRFSGPINRLENDLDRIIAGDTKHKIYIRKKDDLKGIAQRINRLAAKLDQKKR